MHGLLQPIAGRETGPARTCIDPGNDAVIPHVLRVADARGLVRHGTGRDAACVEHLQCGDAGLVSLPMPASLKNAALSGTASANSPELTPPCEAATTIAPASAGPICVIESTITT